LESVSASVIVNSDGKRIGIKNLSGREWSVKTAAGDTHIVYHEKAMPVLNDAKIKFNNDFNGLITK
jgi:hypothetical protein